MKISSASKKVLASALSAAMVVAFAPTVAFGAQDSNTITVEYDLAGGADENAGTQAAATAKATYTVGGENLPAYKKTSDTSVDSSKTYYTQADTTSTGAVKGSDGKYYTKVETADVSKIGDYYEADGKAWTATGTIALQSGTGIKLASGDNASTPEIEGYSFDHWKVTYDKDGDGVIESEDGDFEENAATNGSLNVSDAKYVSGMTVKATAVYKAAALSNVSATAVNTSGKIQFSASKTTGSDANVLGTPKYVVTSPSGTATEKVVGELKDEAVKAEAGTWTVALVDGNGVTLDTQKVYVGKLVLTGALFKDWGWTDVTDKMTDAEKAAAAATQTYTPEQTVWYVASADTTADAVMNNIKGYKEKADGTLEESNGFYTAAGKAAADVKIKAGEKGAVTTELTASFATDKTTIQSLSYDKKAKTLGLLLAGGTPTATNAVSVKTPADAVTTGYYVALSNTEGKVVRESLAVNDGATVVTIAKAMTFSDLEAGTYTATLYKVTKKAEATATTDGTPGYIETVATATAEVADDYAAAPTWAYTAKYKADGTADGGSLVLTNNAGEGYKVTYKIGTGSESEYDTAKGGLTVAAGGAYDYIFRASNDKATEKKSSKSVVLYGYDGPLATFQAAVKAFNTQKVNGKVGSYYAADQSVKDAVKAAEKTFTDKGFAEQAKSGDTDAKAWSATTVAAEQSVVDAVAGVAKAELAKYAAGVASADGKTVSVLSTADYDAAVKAVEAVSAAYAANHDGDKANNVAKANDVTLGALSTYVAAVDNALKDGAKKAKSYKAEDVAAAKTVSDSLKAAKTGAEAKAAVEAYNKLTSTQKELVAASDVSAAQEIIAKAEADENAKALVEAQDEAAVAKVAGKTVKAKAKKTVKSSLKVVTSKSGAKSTFKKTSGNKKITVSAAGKITVKKGLKAGKTYKAKVKATVGAQTKTVTVTVKVAK